MILNIVYIYETISLITKVYIITTYGLSIIQFVNK